MFDTLQQRSKLKSMLIFQSIKSTFASIPYSIFNFSSDILRDQWIKMMKKVVCCFRRKKTTTSISLI